MRLSIIVLLVLCAACSRPLSQNEVEFSERIFGDTLETEKIRVRAGVGILPLPKPKAQEKGKGRSAPRAKSEIPSGVCDRVEVPKEERRKLRFPAGFVLWNQVFLKRDLYLDDMYDGWPKSLPVPHVFLMTHELVHVWQWQNRALTGYTPTRSGAESFGPRDPYYWPERQASAFLSFNYEAQAAIIEDFMCMTLFDPNNPRRAELSRLIRPVLPMKGIP